MESLINTRRKFHLCFVLILVSSLLLLGYWSLGFQGSVHRTFHNDGARSVTGGARKVTVLLWYWPFNVPWNLDGDLCWDLYRIPNCRLVDQRSLYDEADLVIFHNNELIQGQHPLPLSLPRPPGQRWVWLSGESPENNGDMRPFANVFNLTMTYRRDADIMSPYGKILPKKPENEEHGGDRMMEEGIVPQKKTTPVCWIVSNYSPRHRRTQVFQELNSVVPVEVYGRWKGRPLSSEALLPTISRCYFYLAFENTLTKDYITEKLWRNSYLSGAVPVVLGGSLDDYKAVAPPHSFLHVDEFASVKDLGKRLKELVEDKESYAGYLAWRDKWKINYKKNFTESLCDICPQFDRLPRNKVYADLDKWVRV